MQNMSICIKHDPDLDLSNLKIYLYITAIAVVYNATIIYKRMYLLPSFNGSHRLMIIS